MKISKPMSVAKLTKLYFAQRTLLSRGQVLRTFVARSVTEPACTYTTSTVCIFVCVVRLLRWLTGSDGHISPGDIPLGTDHGVPFSMCKHRNYAIGPHYNPPMEATNCGPLSRLRCVHVNRGSS